MFSDSNSILSEIKNRLDLVDIVSDYVPLKKTGRNFKGLCPFHGEKTPSFIVSPEKQIFHCFGCHEGGDLFRFLMRVDNLSFPEALERLAKRAGLELKQSRSPTVSKDEKEVLFQANRVAAWYYHETLKKSPLAEKARHYLEQRGLTGREIEKFRLGFSPSSSTELISLYQSREIPLEAALKTGILRKGDYGFFESFRGRLTFPIFNREQKVVGLGGRIMENREDVAKYINSPDSPIYDKSSTLFGLSLAKEAIRKKNRIFVVEGYLDVIAMHQFGFEETVAPLGTALTSKQINLIKRYIDEIIVLFDSDEAGWKAAIRSLDLFLEQELSPKVLLLPSGEDPDTYLRKYGTDGFEGKLKEVRNLFSLIIDKTIAKNPKDIAGRAASMNELRPYLKKVTHPLERNLYVRRIAEGLDVPEVWVFEELGLSAQKQLRKQEVPPPQTMAIAEEILMELFLKFEDLRMEILDKVKPSEFLNKKIQELAVFLWNQEDIHSISLSEIVSRTGDSPLQQTLTELALRESPMDVLTAPALAKDCMKKVKQMRLKQKLGVLSLQIKEAEEHQEQERVLNLLKEKQHILSEMTLTK